MTLISKDQRIKFDIALSIVEESGQFRLSMEYPVLFITRGDASKLLRTFETAVRQMISNWDTPLGQLSMMSCGDSSQIQQWNDREWPASNRCIHEMIQQTVIDQPSRPAICSWDGELTYSELDNLSSRLASHLQRDLGCGSDSVVVLCFEKSLWAVVSMLAVAKVGSAFVHVDINAPPERNRTIVRQCRCDVGLSSPTNAEKLQILVPASVVVSGDTMERLRQSTYDTKKATPANILYIIFTSGSTGIPKGVDISHRSFCSAVTYNQSWLRIQSHSRVLQFTSYTFDASLEEMFTVLVSGGCICIPSEEDRVSDLTGLIRRMNVNWAAFTPSFMRTLDPKQLVPSVNFITVHAESMNASLVHRWADEVELRPSYGPTECSVTSCVGAPFSITSDSANIGWPVGCRAWLVNPHNHDVLVPVGAVGELVLDGPIVGNGYLGDPEKTLASFINPAWNRRQDNTKSQRNCYKTGDLVRYDSRDGSLLFLGRKDPLQVKIRGQRVEICEIENRLDALSQVVHSAVIVPGSGLLKSRLVAVLSLTTMGHIPENKDTRDHKIQLVSLAVASKHRLSVPLQSIQRSLQQTLPAYMVPEEWLVVTRLPVRVSQKFDRQTTIQWVEELDQDVLDMARTLSSESPVHSGNTSTMNDVEEAIRDIWANVLKLPRDRVPLDMSFFQLGGDSIYAIELMQLCRKRGLVLTTKDVLAHPTVRRLAQVAQSSQQTNLTLLEITKESASKEAALKTEQTHPGNLLKNIDLSLLPFPSECVEAVWPCTPFQRRMFHAFHCRENSPYLFDSLIELENPELNPRYLLESWKRTVERHEILRTAFLPMPDRSEKLLQVVLKDFCPDVSLVDTAATEQEVLQNVGKHLDLLQARLFKDNAPPVSLQIYDVHQQQQPTKRRVFVHLAMSHLLIDHVSFHHIISDWQRICEAQAVATLAELHIPTFGAYSNHTYHKEKDASNVFWSSVLQDARPCLLSKPCITNYPAEPTLHRMKSEKFSFEVTTDLDRFCRTAGTTLATVLQFAWAIVINLQTGQSDVCFGHLVSDRDDSHDFLGCDANKIVGPMLVLAIGRVCFAGKSGNLLDSLDKLHTHNVQALGHRIFDLEEVEHDLGIDITQLFDTLVSIRKVHFHQDNGSVEDDMGMRLRSIAKHDPHEVSGIPPRLLYHYFRPCQSDAYENDQKID